MTSRILPQLVLKTVKEFRNVFYMTQNIKNQDDNQSPESIGCKIFKHKYQHPKRELLPITLTILPVIFAIHCGPEKPPPMRYTELPIYDSPHAKYKDSQDNKAHKCQKHKQKIVQEALEPYVTHYRCLVNYVFCEVNEWFDWIKCEVTTTFEALKFRGKKFVSYMRDDKNFDLRRAFVAFGSATGFVFGSRNYYLSRNLSFGVLAALLTGWLCFPKDTDMLLRSCCYYIGTKIVCFINFVCGSADGQEIKLEKRSPLLPCLKDICEPTVYPKER